MNRWSSRRRSSSDSSSSILPPWRGQVLISGPVPSDVKSEPQYFPPTHPRYVFKGPGPSSALGGTKGAMPLWGVWSASPSRSEESDSEDTQVKESESPMGPTGGRKEPLGREGGKYNVLRLTQPSTSGFCNQRSMGGQKGRHVSGRPFAIRQYRFGQWMPSMGRYRFAALQFTIEPSAAALKHRLLTTL